MKKIIVVLLVVFAFSATFAQSASKKVSEYNLENKVAIQGYDPVSYFKQNKAVKGKKEIAASYDGVMYQFSSVTNKEIFSKNPPAFEPQYGGWCAYAMGSAGEKVEINPETFKIIDGKLYLFYNAFFNNTLKSWNKEEATLKAKADANWKKIINKKS
jgi:YHS domain-containing protein